LLRLIPFGWVYYYPPMPLTLAIALIALLTPITVAQRIYTVWKQIQSEKIAEVSSRPFNNKVIKKLARKE
jgi:hypothetical protein